MNAAFGDVSAGGLGSPESDVTQTGGGPNAFVASQGNGNSGGITLSKFSVDVIRPAHGCGHRPGRVPVTVGPIAMAMSNNNKTAVRNRIGVSAGFKVLIIEERIRYVLPKVPKRSQVSLDPACLIT